MENIFLLLDIIATQQTGAFADAVGSAEQGNTHCTRKAGEPDLLPFGTVSHRRSDEGKSQAELFCMIPFERNKDMVPREFIFHELDQKLPPIQDYQTAAIWGIGGAG